MTTSNKKAFIVTTKYTLKRDSWNTDKGMYKLLGWTFKLNVNPGLSKELYLLQKYLSDYCD